MFPFVKTFPTPAEHHIGKNTCELIIVHHTGTPAGTIQGVLDGLYRRPDYASCHFVVDVNGDAYKIGDPTDILWHAGESSWKGRTDMNRYAIGIEIVGTNESVFTKEQKRTVRALIEHLMAVFNIPAENVLRHKDIAPKRKVDVADQFWRIHSWEDYQKTLIPHKI